MKPRAATCPGILCTDQTRWGGLGWLDLQDSESTSVLKVFLIEALTERYLFIEAFLASLGSKRWEGCGAETPNSVYP